MGVGTNRMNKYTVGMATQGLANYMKENCEGPLSVCISFDSRNNSPEFAQIAANVLAANGIHVYIFDKLHPIALMSYSVRMKKATAGIMITASHNPKEYNANIPHSTKWFRYFLRFGVRRSTFRVERFFFE